MSFVRRVGVMGFRKAHHNPLFLSGVTSLRRNMIQEIPEVRFFGLIRGIEFWDQSMYSRSFVAFSI